METEHAAQLAVFGWELLVHRTVVLRKTVDQVIGNPDVPVGKRLSARSLARLEANRHLITHLATSDGYAYLLDKLAAYQSALPRPIDGQVKSPADPDRAIAELSIPSVTTLDRIDATFGLEPGTASRALRTQGTLGSEPPAPVATVSVDDLNRHMKFAVALAKNVGIDISDSDAGITAHAARSHVVPGGGMKIEFSAREVELITEALKSARAQDDSTDNDQY